MTDAKDAIRHDGQQVADLVLARARHDPTIALGILGVAVDAVLDTVPDPAERRSLLSEFTSAFEDDTP